MDIKDAARRVMAAKLVADAVRAHGEPVKAALLDALTGDGVEMVRVKDDSGTNFGTVSVAGNRQKKAKVVDEAVFVAWVKRTRPTEVVEVVRPATQKALLDAATKAGDDVPVDTVTGEVIPGVEMQEGEPYLTLRPTPLAKELMADTLAGSGLLALAVGEQPEGEATDA